MSNHHRRKLLPLCIAASLLSGLSVGACAIGVGEIHLQSSLGAPLQAEVPLNHLDDLSADQLKVQLATQSDYNAMGVEYSYLHAQLKIEPFIRDGRGYVRISTHEPVTEPYLDFVLSLRWPQGQLVREFTVLLDPPTQAVATAQMPAATTQAVPPLAAKSEPKSAAPHRMPAPAERAEIPRAGHYTVQRGDSLWRIANRVRPSQVPVEQVMAAIQAHNPNAFINGNPNLLKEAMTITLPDAEQIAAAANAVPASVAAREPVAAGPIAATAEPQAAQPPAELAEENSALKAQVADLTSNVAALNQSLAESEQRMHQLESQLNTLIQQMQQQRATVAALSGAAESHGGSAVQGAGSVINQVNAAELHGPQKAHTPWWVHLLYWLGIGGAVTWAVREHFWPQRRLVAAATGGVPDFANAFVPAAPLGRSVVESPTEVRTVSDAAELTLDLDTLPMPAETESGEAAPQLFKSNEEPVDASISAGVFVAFGRFQEAESLLRDSMAREPKRMDLKLQLLDVLMQSDQPGAFDDLAAEIERDACTPEELAELAVLRDSYRPRH